MLITQKMYDWSAKMLSNSVLSLSKPLGLEPIIKGVPCIHDDNCQGVTACKVTGNLLTLVKWKICKHGCSVELCVIYVAQCIATSIAFSCQSILLPAVQLPGSLFKLELNTSCADVTAHSAALSPFCKCQRWALSVLSHLKHPETKQPAIGPLSNCNAEIHPQSRGFLPWICFASRYAQNHA